MTNIENLNQIAETNETPDEKAVGMLLVHIGSEYGFELDIDKYMSIYQNMKKWLNSEVKAK